ncbi:MAG: hypothetical protein KAJ01_03235 [Candidatus Hydrogenedentes bacterium]|nr:hypothetical protein [Candidatus Hydrogenedentota bacterium]
MKVVKCSCEAIWCKEYILEPHSFKVEDVPEAIEALARLHAARNFGDISLVDVVANAIHKEHFGRPIEEPAFKNKNLPEIPKALSRRIRTFSFKMNEDYSNLKKELDELKGEIEDHIAKKASDSWKS